MGPGTPRNIYMIEVIYDVRALPGRLPPSYSLPSHTHRDTTP